MTLFTSLDVSMDPTLTELHCAHTQISELDLSNNTELTTLEFASNQLATLDLTKNIALTTLKLGVGLSTLDLSKKCSFNYL